MILETCLNRAAHFFYDPIYLRPTSHEEEVNLHFKSNLGRMFALYIPEASAVHVDYSISSTVWSKLVSSLRLFVTGISN